jgi:hypothetical protein
VIGKHLVRRVRNFLFPNRWSGCNEPLPEERLATWERRLGEHRAQQRLRQARVHRDIDARAARSPTVRVGQRPRLPA